MLGSGGLLGGGGVLGALPACLLAPPLPSPTPLPRLTTQSVWDAFEALCEREFKGTNFNARPVFIKIGQKPGELVWVPPGWVHMVINDQVRPALVGGWACWRWCARSSALQTSRPPCRHA